MQRTVSGFAVCAAALTIATTAHAQVSTVEGGGFVGVDHFGRDIELGNSFFADQIPGTSFALGARAGWHATRWVGAELELRLAFGSTEGAPEMARESLRTTILGVRAQAVFDLTTDGRAFSPIAVAGVGFDKMFIDAPPELAVESDTDAELHWGVGFKYDVPGRRYGLRVDLRQAITAARQRSATITYEAQAGIYYAFGKQAPATRARLVDTRGDEPAPDSRPATPGVVPDVDGDGLPDAVDHCRTQPEIFNSIDDDDGCPEIDSDGDGLLGTRDDCPDAAEDPDGFEDADGCPDLDNDGDGRSDRIDVCPNEAEDLNGFQDEDGCPDKIPPRVARFTGTIKGIHFKRGSAKLLSRSHRVLDQVRAVLLEFPSIHLEISGHTDSTGDEAANVELSRGRADAVKWYLVDKGIAAERITTIGHGSSKPRGDNASRVGRALNRRVEFQLVPGPANVDDASAAD